MESLFQAINKIVEFIINTVNNNINEIIKNPLLVLIFSILILKIIWNLIWKIVDFINEKKHNVKLKRTIKRLKPGKHIIHDGDNIIKCYVNKNGKYKCYNSQW